MPSDPATNTVKPHLSIVVPTYNRAKVLAKSLPWMRRQVEPFGDAVEVIVSDNHSPDGTQAILSQFTDWAQLRVVSPSQHVPPHEHFLWLGTETPRADYCWMLGDDDFPLQEGIARVLAAVTAPDPVDYVLLNVAVLPLEVWLGMAEGRAQIPMNELWQARITPHARDVRSDHLRDILECGGGDIFIFCGVPAHVFKPAVWRTRMEELSLMHTSNDGRFTNLENTFPHLAILYACEGRGSFQFVHEACAVQSCGAQEWAADQLKLLTNAQPGILAQYRRVGVSEAYLRRAEQHCMSHQWKTVAGLLARHRSARELGRCLRLILRSHPGAGAKLRSLRAALPHLANAAYSRMPEGLKNIWRGLKRPAAA